MNKSGLYGILAALVCGGSLALGYFAGNSRAEAPVAVEPMVITADAQPTDKAAIEAIVHDYLMQNPEILNEVQVALQTKQENESKLTQTKFIATASNEIFNSTNDAIIGGDPAMASTFKRWRMEY